MISNLIKLGKEDIKKRRPKVEMVLSYGSQFF
jgi:hypothetical protein